MSLKLRVYNDIIILLNFGIIMFSRSRLPFTEFLGSVCSVAVWCDIGAA